MQFQDAKMALAVYLRANATEKSLIAHADRRL